MGADSKSALFFKVVMASSVQTQEICGMCGDVITKNAKGSLYKAGAETIFKISENLKDGLAEKLKSM